MYLAAGIPVIIWEEAALADFIRENQCGITIKSISEIRKLVDNMSDEYYRKIYKNKPFTLIIYSFKQIHYIKIAIALVLGSMASLWVKLLGLGNFITLVISAVLFFGAYALVLLAFKEEIVIEILETFKLKKRGEVEK